jgi:hypothetical protein
MATRIKGASLINTIGIMREVLGVTRFQEIVARCPVQTQNLIRRTLIALEWVPLEQWAPFLQAIYEHICHKDEPQFRRLMRAVCKRDFSTLYRSYVTQASPHSVLEKVDSIWSSYFDSGSLTLAPSSPPETEAAQPAGTDKPQRLVLQMRTLETSSPVYAMIMHAYLEQLMFMVGAKTCTIQREHEQLQDGKLSCDYIINLGP